MIKRGNLIMGNESKKELIQSLLNSQGNGYRVAKLLKVKPQTIYQRMAEVGIKPEPRKLLEGEPAGYIEKRVWLRKLLKEHKTVKGVAEALHITKSAVRDRMARYGIKAPHSLTEEQKVRRLDSFKKVFAKCKNNCSATARVYGVSNQAVHERAKRYQLI